MNAMQKLLHRVNEMDITEQLNWLGDANMPYQANIELAEFGASVAPFLETHKRGCGANKGVDCTCGLITAREKLEQLTGKSWTEQGRAAAQESERT